MTKHKCAACGRDVSGVEATSFGLGIGGPMSIHFHAECAPPCHHTSGIIDLREIKRWADEQRAAQR